MYFTYILLNRTLDLSFVITLVHHIKYRLEYYHIQHLDYHINNHANDNHLLNHNLQDIDGNEPMYQTLYDLSRH